MTTTTATLTETEGLSRRKFLVGAGAATAGAAALTLGTPKRANAAASGDGDVVILTFMRGGADGLAFLAPHDDKDYDKLRNSTRLSKATNVKIPGTDAWGLNPTLKDLTPLLDGQAAFVPAFGHGHITRSHFDSMNIVEAGTITVDAPGGWLARLQNERADNGNPLRAVNLGDLLVASLRGADNAVATRDLATCAVPFGGDNAKDILLALAGSGQDPYRRGQRVWVNAIKEAQRIDAGFKSSADYPTHSYGKMLADASKLIRADVGTQCIVADIGGWDSHIAQNAMIGPVQQTLAKSIATFFAEIGDHSKRVTMLVFSEFGRRASEHPGAGTDHGHGGVLMAFGNVNPGVHGVWNGLGPEALDQGDVPVLNDWRTVLGLMANKRVNIADPKTIFPDAPAVPAELTNLFK